MRLLLISQDFPPDIGGIQTYCYELATRFTKYNEDFSVVVPNKKTADEIDIGLPYTVHRVKSSNAMLPYTAVPVIRSLTRKGKFDTTFHAQWQTVLGVLKSRENGDVKKIFAAAHGRELLFNPFRNDSYIGKKYVKYRRWLLSKVDHFFAVSHYTANLLIHEGVAKERISVMPNGTNPNEFYPTSVDKLRTDLHLDQQPIIMTITRLVPRKGVDIGIKAIKKVVQTHPEVQYMIVGDGEHMPELKSLVDELKLNKNVTFLGKVPHKYVNSYYNLGVIFIMTPRTEPLNIEGFGIVYLEANACGKPVIGSRSGGIPDAIVDGETGLLVNEENPDQLAAAIIKLLEDKKLANDMGERGRKRIINETNWDIIAEKIHKIMIKSLTK
ncbi:MAG TPA: glycosyltransferase family 4 protein [Balneolales bacterium]|nr:glycosyltransferase family 4 protein [Balneolales bacterium]